MFFSFYDGNTEALWTTDGTAPGTPEAFNSGVGSTLLINGYLAGDGVLFFHGPTAAPGSSSG